MSEEELSKRERQRARREAKREEQLRAQRKAKRNRTLAIAGLVVMALAGIGAFTAVWWADREARGDVLEADTEVAQTAGCQPMEQPDDLGGQHFSGDPQELAEAPPEDIYDHRPATSGIHLPQVAVTGVYPEHVDERLLLHNLEHGYVVVWWDPELPDDEVAELTDWAEEAIDDGWDHLVAAPYAEPLPDGGNVAYTSWGYRMLCDDFEPEVAEAFLDERHDAADVPEAAAGPHMGDLEGELDPETDEVVFPPLEGATDQAPGADAMNGDDEDG